MVRVEKMKKTMLGKVEGRVEKGNYINVVDEKEEALYRIGELPDIDGTKNDRNQ